MSRGGAQPIPAVETKPWWRRGPGEEGWSSLSFGARDLFLRTFMDKEQRPATAPEAAVSELRERGFLTKEDLVGGAELTPFATGLSLACVGRLLDDSPDLEGYVRFVYRDFTDAHRLAQSAGARGGFSAADPFYALVTYPMSASWAEWALPEKKRTPAESLLLDTLRRSGGRIAVKALAELLPNVPRSELDRARSHLVERLIIFHGASRDTLELELGFLACEQHRLKGSVEALAPVSESLVETFSAPLLAQDAVSVLLELAREPAKLKRDGQLYAKAFDRIVSVLTPLPTWIQKRFPNLDPIRFELVQSVLTEHGLIGKQAGALAQTDCGRAFLAVPSDERPAKLFPGRGASLSPERAEAAHFSLQATSIVMPLSGRPLSYSPTNEDRRALRNSVAARFERLEAGRFYLVDAFLERAITRGGPLARGEDPKRVRATVGYETVPADEAALSQASRFLLEQVLWARLLLIGGIELGLHETKTATKLAFALNPLGRYYLGLDAEAPRVSATSERAASRAIVQPNLEIVLLDACASVVAEMQAFSENAGVGTSADRARVFKLTKASVQGAARAGLDAGAILGALERHAQAPVPDNVARAIRDWAGACRRVSIGRARVLRCPDQETLTRVAAAIGEAGEALSFALELKAPPSPALKKKLEKLGIFLECTGCEEHDDRGARSRWNVEAD